MLDYIKFWFRSGAVVVTTLIDSVLVILLTLTIPRRYNYFRHYKRWAGRVLFFSGVKVKVVGLENINHDETSIYICNHSTLFDIPIVFTAIPENIKIMYKRELEKVFIFGWALKKSPFIPIERTKPRDAMGSIDEALSSIKENVSVILFPEGTRSKDGILRPFKRGAFLLASRSGKPIVPMTIIGSTEILPRRSFRFNRREVTVIFHEPILNPVPLERKDEQVLVDKVFTIIKNTLEQNH